MSKVDKLGWMSGIVLNVMGQRIGVRVNSRTALELLLAICREQGWSWDRSEEPVQILYSFRVGDQPLRRGQRSFHLIYLLAGRITRTLDLQELVSSFRSSVWAIAALASEGKVLLQGRTLVLGGKTIFVPGSSLDVAPLCKELSGARVLRDHYLQMDCDDPVGTSGLDAILFLTDEEGTLSPGAATVQLLRSSMTPVRRSMPVLGVLAQGCPHIVVSGPSIHEVDERLRAEIQRFETSKEESHEV